ncbi:RNA polymerase sigma factor RpoH [Psychrobacter sp. I-STPA10]|uniref:RNA polymerase sigma factor RpoH n=1 Tax=Psychrobacter sp. I-STPA10 TaxID=2585769 RepID=UPI001E4A9B1F|nr:RNA polymerase sigma factor RpoH [Psychrobacter sp. I-STPA10]
MATSTPSASRSKAASSSKKSKSKTTKKQATTKQDTQAQKKGNLIDDAADVTDAQIEDIVDENLDDEDLDNEDLDVLDNEDLDLDDIEFSEQQTLAQQQQDEPTEYVSPMPNTSTRDLVPAMPVNLTAPGVNLGAYINSVHQIPILTTEQEQELAHRYYDDGDIEAARLLVMSHLRFVIHIARSYSGYGLPQADLIQEGNLGLMKAVKRFDPNKGVRLVSFAVHWIKAEIHEFVIRNWRIVKVATTKAHRKLFFNLRSLKKTNNQLTLEEADAIAKDLNVSRKQVLEMESRLTSYDASFEAQTSDDDEGRYAPQLFLEDDVDPAEMVEEADWEENNSQALMIAMDTLDERSRDIVEQRWLSEQKSTLHELAAVYNISAERVRQIEKNAMDKIREAMTIDSVIMPD